MGFLRFTPYSAKARRECEAVINGHVGSYLAVGEEKDFARFLDQIERGDKSVFFWVAERDNSIVGCCGLSVEDEDARLLWGILAKGELGKGYGQEMLDHRIDWIKRNLKHVTNVLCHTAPLTEGFFAKNGFVAFHRQANYWGGTLELVAMRKALEHEAI